MSKIEVKNLDHFRFSSKTIDKNRRMSFSIKVSSLEPVFASKPAEQDFFDRIWFSRIRVLTCR
jgi:hypothetical protein